MIARTTIATHNPRISAQTVTNRLREIGEISPYTMYVLYAAFLFWPSICYSTSNLSSVTIHSVDFSVLTLETSLYIRLISQPFYLFLLYDGVRCIDTLKPV